MYHKAQNKLSKIVITARQKQMGRALKVLDVATERPFFGRRYISQSSLSTALVVFDV